MATATDRRPSSRGKPPPVTGFQVRPPSSDLNRPVVTFVVSPLTLSCHDRNEPTAYPGGA